ncbi:MAG: 4Fe-4S binding protein, partial [Candidatus Bathyarchaeota archaeon]
KEVCPVDAITKDRITGIVAVDLDLCIGCKACTKACPWAVIKMDYEKGVAVNCDLCAGDPECVRVCTLGALKFLKTGRATASRKSEYARKTAKAMETASSVVQTGGST